MDLSQYVSQLREDFSSAAAAGDEQTQRTAALLGAAIEPAARLALLNALSDFAAEVTAALDDQVVEVRLDGRDVRVSVTGHDTPSDTVPTPPGGPLPGLGKARFGGPGVDGPGFGGNFGLADTGDISRITLRLVEQIKGQAEQAAAQQGVSLNSWVAQAVQGALAGGGRGRHGGPSDVRNDRENRRIKGWVQG